MSNFLRKVWGRIALFALVALITLPLQSLAPFLASAQGIDTWVDGETPQLVIGEKLSTDDAFPPTCYDETFYYLSYTKPNGDPDPIGRQVPINVCARRVGTGEVGSAIYQYIRPGTNIAFRVVTTLGTDTGITPNPYNGGFSYRSASGNIALFDSLAAAGKFEKITNINQLGYRLNPIADNQYLRDSAGNKITIRTTGYSSGGTWMVVYADGLGLLRINTLTHAMLLFDMQKYNFDLGFIPGIEFAISDDGNTVVRSGSGLHPVTTKVFDLSGCQSAPFVMNANNITAGCRSRDVQTDLTTDHLGYDFMFNMRFIGDGNGVRGTAAIRNSNGVDEYYSATYSVAGHTPPQVTYLALGDSFSSGEGETDDSYYIDGTKSPDEGNGCHLSIRSYPYLAAQTLGLSNSFHSVACSGARYDPDYTAPQHRNIPVDTPSRDWIPGLKAQEQFVSNSSPNIVTISMIGNDIGFVDKLSSCLIGTEPCFHFRESRMGVANEIYNKFDDLFNLYTDIKNRSASGAKIYVLGYPQLFSGTDDCDPNVYLDPEERAVARGMTTYLNAVIKAATIKAGVQYIDVENTFAGHQQCEAGKKAENGLAGGDDIAGILGNESYHPNAYGHELLRDALLVQSDDFNRAMPIASPMTSAPYTESVAYNNFIGDAPTAGSALQLGKYWGEQTVGVFVKGTKVIFNPTGVLLQASSPFVATFHSDPVTAGTIYTDELGNLSGEITVPESLPTGFHALHLYGKDIAGQDIDLYRTVFVAASSTDYDGDGIPNDQEKCLAAEPANVDHDRDGIDDACDPQIGEPPADAIPPEVTGTPDREPNANGWYNSDVTISWASVDPEPSSGAPTQPASTIASLEGENLYKSDPSCDPANNCATGNLTLKLDKTLPTLGVPIWTNSPKSTLANASIEVPATDNLSGIDEAEYFLGDTDPGQGNGATMQVNGDSISVNFGTDFPTGVYKVTMRTKDKAGNWSVPASDYLVVYDPFGTRMTGKKTLVPSLTSGDLLPGLSSDTQSDKAKFGFNVRYDNAGGINPNSDLQFEYKTGSGCQKPTKAVNCHQFDLDATSIAWLITQGQNNSTGIFQGDAKLEVDGSTSNVAFRLIGLDGERLDTAGQDHLVLKIYGEDADLNTANPIYQVGEDVARGNIKISTR